MNPVRCPKCGKINDGTTYFCIYCGTIFDDYEKEDIEIPKILTRKINETEEKLKEDTPKIQNPLDSQLNGKSNHRLAIIIGYFFAIMGGLIGFIISIYLITRKDPNAKRHGKIQLAILIFWLIFMGLLIWSGSMDYHMLLTPMNLSSMQGNITGINGADNLNNLLTFP